ncbi:alpha-D-ribose 1-methylphosphonate 5-triphosphate diphosphatase [Dethiosulfatibacter aminovorans DSM 17477]|uniref:Alpha-D-ribose 1-methylphosphonate 5-triphosphate diphosphatase n=1 Tax=Dethiosulfatibacter aminovorans DSM 17477 TaxID=1121476 RepID=A0A1M6AYV0_9FIRM|nr:phosphonate metabolism protein PhnM [Dethiosulfatibacter aminovorans]SHI41655.1 alpha-D-ribose 1-methylphosphonate 5-triphosphate diphosphatase [Dethiosulfatibacter aminovorans DSM 17477]
MIRLTNGRIVLKDRIIEGRDLIIREDIIEGLPERNEAIHIEGNREVELVDVNGAYITPGFVDIHADYIEQMGAPRPTSMMDLNLAMRETERVLATHGITTMFHSLSIMKDMSFDKNPIRQMKYVRTLTDIIDEIERGQKLIRHKFHARFEMESVDCIEELKGFINDGKVDLVSFMDHSPGQGQYSNVERYREDLIKMDNDLNEDNVDDYLESIKTVEKASHQECIEIAELARSKNIAVASHDDDTMEKLDCNEEIGVTISEFPIRIDVAKKAKEKGFHTIAGAPNVMLGGSHSGNLAAHEAIQEGCIDILCSDYYPASMLHSVFKLHETYGHDLAEMFALVTINPAKAVKLDDVLGSIEIGKKADLLVIDKLEETYPVVSRCYVNGSEVMRMSY